MFIRFIRMTINMLLDVETIPFLAMETSLYSWRHVGTNGDQTVV